MIASVERMIGDGVQNLLHDPTRSFPGLAFTSAATERPSPPQSRRMKSILFVLLIGSSAAHAQALSPPVALHPDALAGISVSPGVTLKELTGRAASAPARSTMASVALFRLAPGKASAWSHNKVGEESFFILKGHGEVWTGNQRHAVRPGSFILIAPDVVRSIRAGKGEALQFYAVTTPAWSRDDDVLVDAPDGAPK